MNAKTLTGGALWLLLGAGLVLGAPACSRNFNSYCTEFMDCVDGNDADIEACEVQEAQAREYAHIVGCGDEYERHFDCVEIESKCENDFYTPEDDCELETLEYNACISD